MKKILASAIMTAALGLSLAAYAADQTTTTDNPPANAAVYSCWDVMKDGQIQHMRGPMMSGPRGGMMMGGPGWADEESWKQMQQNMQDMRQQMNEMHQWMMQSQTGKNK
jgi:hypothetical protein